MSEFSRPPQSYLEANSTLFNRIDELTKNHIATAAPDIKAAVTFYPGDENRQDVNVHDDTIDEATQVIEDFLALIHTLSWNVIVPSHLSFEKVRYSPELTLKTAAIYESPDIPSARNVIIERAGQEIGETLQLVYFGKRLVFAKKGVTSMQAISEDTKRFLKIAQTDTEMSKLELIELESFLANFSAPGEG